MVIAVVGASDGVTFCVDSPYGEIFSRSGVEVKRRARWRASKGVRQRPGEGMVKRALTSCEFGKLRQVLQLSSELRQKARDEIEGMMGVKESLEGVDSWRCQGPLSTGIGGCQRMPA